MRKAEWIWAAEYDYSMKIPTEIHRVWPSITFLKNGILLRCKLLWCKFLKFLRCKLSNLTNIPLNFTFSWVTGSRKWDTTIKFWSLLHPRHIYNKIYSIPTTKYENRIYRVGDYFQQSIKMCLSPSFIFISNEVSRHSKWLWYMISF